MANAAIRRLNYILSDELYGPKLARLTGEDERRVLELIDQNRGKEARAAILEADERRRARKRQVSRTKENVVARPVNREQKEDAAVANIMRQYGRKARREAVIRNVGYMTIAELDFAAEATEQDLIGEARRPASRKNSVGKDVNPFWYH